MNRQFLDWIRELATQLSLSDEPLSPKNRHGLQVSQDMLQAVRERYQPAAPAGAEAVRVGMLEALGLFSDALSLIEDVDAGGDPGCLREAIEKAEEANDLLEQIQYLLEQTEGP